MMAVKKSFDQKKNGGFTIVEVLTVLLLLAILAAIVIPSVVVYVQKAQDEACKTTLAMLSRGIRSSLILSNGQGLSYDELSRELDENYNVKMTNFGNIRDICPAGGVYSVKLNGNDFSLSCSIHGSLDISDVDTAVHHIGVLMTLDSFQSYFDEKEAKCVDSTDPNDGTLIKENFSRILGLGSDAGYEFRIYFDPKQEDAHYLIYLYPALTEKKEGDIVGATRIFWNEQKCKVMDSREGTVPLKKETRTDSITGEKISIWVIDDQKFSVN